MVDNLPLLCACCIAVHCCKILLRLLLLLPDLSAILKVIKIARKSLTSGTNTRWLASCWLVDLAYWIANRKFPLTAPASASAHHICLFSELLKLHNMPNETMADPQTEMDALISWSALLADGRKEQQEPCQEELFASSSARTAALLLASLCITKHQIDSIKFQLCQCFLASGEYRPSWWYFVATK